MHDDCAGSGWYVPMAQARHADWPCRLWYCPAAQACCALSPSPPAKYPVLAVTHEEEASAGW